MNWIISSQCGCVCRKLENERPRFTSDRCESCQMPATRMSVVTRRDPSTLYVNIIQIRQRIRNDFTVGLRATQIHKGVLSSKRCSMSLGCTHYREHMGNERQCVCVCAFTRNGMNVSYPKFISRALCMLKTLRHRARSLESRTYGNYYRFLLFRIVNEGCNEAVHTK